MHSVWDKVKALVQGIPFIGVNYERLTGTFETWRNVSGGAGLPCGCWLGACGHACKRVSHQAVALLVLMDGGVWC